MDLGKPSRTTLLGIAIAMGKDSIPKSQNKFIEPILKMRDSRDPVQSVYHSSQIKRETLEAKAIHSRGS
jgi:hypothetical protein